jgi:hypothetical protein
LNPKQNFNCDQTIQKPNENNGKVKKSIAEISNSNHIKNFDYYGPNFSKPTVNQFSVSPVTSPRSFKKIGDSMELKWKKME